MFVRLVSRQPQRTKIKLRSTLKHYVSTPKAQCCKLLTIGFTKFTVTRSTKYNAPFILTYFRRFSFFLFRLIYFFLASVASKGKKSSHAQCCPIMRTPRTPSTDARTTLQPSPQPYPRPSTYPSPCLYPIPIPIRIPVRTLSPPPYPIRPLPPPSWLQYCQPGVAARAEERATLKTQ